MTVVALPRKVSSEKAWKAKVLPEVVWLLRNVGVGDDEVDVDVDVDVAVDVRVVAELVVVEVSVEVLLITLC
jgi:hypothetical protein